MTTHTDTRAMAMNLALTVPKGTDILNDGLGRRVFWVTSLWPEHQSPVERFNGGSTLQTANLTRAWANTPDGYGSGRSCSAPKSQT